jgi:hypothetical protein
MRIDGNKKLALPQLLDVSISFRLIVLAFILLIRACVVPQSSTNGLSDWEALQLRRCVTQSYVDVLTQRTRRAARVRFRSLMRRRVRRSVLHVGAVLTYLARTIDASRWQSLRIVTYSGDTFCTSGTSP